MTRTLLDPTSERRLAIRERAARLDTLQGKTVGFLDISKSRGDVFLDRLQTQLEEHGASVLRFAKPTFAKPAPVDLRHSIATQCHAVVEALADWGSCTSCSVHDTADLEARGIPAVCVATVEFRDGAETQARALGADIATVFVSHPIQDRTDPEMQKIADEAVPAIVEALCAT